MSLDYQNFETATNVKCAVCGDTLAEWEERVCIICECD